MTEKAANGAGTDLISGCRKKQNTRNFSQLSTNSSSFANVCGKAVKEGGVRPFSTNEGNLETLQLHSPRANDCNKYEIKYFQFRNTSIFCFLTLQLREIRILQFYDCSESRFNINCKDNFNVVRDLEYFYAKVTFVQRYTFIYVATVRVSSFKVLIQMARCCPAV